MHHLNYVFLHVKIMILANSFYLVDFYSHGSRFPHKRSLSVIS